MLSLILLYFMLGSVFPLGRLAVRAAEPIFFTSARMVFAGIILLIYFYIRYPEKFRIYVKLRYFKIWFILALFNIYLTNVLEFWGLQTIPAAKASFIYNLSPFFAALFSYLFFKEKMTIKKIVGLVIGVVGFIPLLYASSENLQGSFFSLSWGELALIGAAASTALGWTFMRKIITKTPYPPILLNGLSMVICSVMAFFTSLFLENWTPLPIMHYKQFIIYGLMISLVSNFIGYNLYAHLLRKYTATFLSFCAFIQPFFAALLGWILLGEGVTWHFFASAFIVLIGLYIFYQEELNLGYIKK